jgi:hypothetical protein
MAEYADSRSTGGSSAAHVIDALERGELLVRESSAVAVERHIQVGAECRAEPMVETRAEARDHQSNAVHGRDRDRERGRRDAGSAQRRADARMAKRLGKARPRRVAASSTHEQQRSRRRQRAPANTPNSPANA